MKTSKSNEFKAGDTVMYTCVSGAIHPKVLIVKPDGNLILETRDKYLPIFVKGLKTKKTTNLSKNVCVKPHRVKKL